MTFRLHPRPFLGASAALAALLALDPSSASACSCVGLPDPATSIARADVVFEGTPRDTALLEAEVAVPGYFGARRFDFEVARYFKGQLGPDVAIFTSDQGTACGRTYPLHQSYVVYANYTDQGLLIDSSCSPSHPSSAASGDVPLLGAGVAPDPSLVSGDGDADGEDDATDGAEAPEASSGIHRVPLDTEPEARGCAASLALPPAHEGTGLLALAALALAASALRRRRAS